MLTQLEAPFVPIPIAFKGQLCFSYSLLVPSCMQKSLFYKVSSAYQEEHCCKSERRKQRRPLTRLKLHDSFPLWDYNSLSQQEVESRSCPGSTASVLCGQLLFSIPWPLETSHERDSLLFSLEALSLTCHILLTNI